MDDWLAPLNYDKRTHQAKDGREEKKQYSGAYPINPILQSLLNSPRGS